MNKTYRSTGLVFGNYWGGGRGCYPAVNLMGDTKEIIMEEAKKKVENGSLDSGMGYESLIGAVIEIEEIKIIVFEGEVFYKSEFETEFVGDLTEEQRDFLLECLDNQ